MRATRENNAANVRRQHVRRVEHSVRPVLDLRHTIAHPRLRILSPPDDFRAVQGEASGGFGETAFSADQRTDIANLGLRHRKYGLEQPNRVIAIALEVNVPDVAWRHIWLPRVESGLVMLVDDRAVRIYDEGDVEHPVLHQFRVLRNHLRDDVDTELLRQRPECVGLPARNFRRNFTGNPDVVRAAAETPAANASFRNCDQLDRQIQAAVPDRVANAHGQAVDVLHVVVPRHGHAGDVLDANGGVVTAHRWFLCCC